MIAFAVRQIRTRQTLGGIKHYSKRKCNKKLWKVNPVRELRSLTACADGGFREPGINKIGGGFKLI